MSEKQAQLRTTPGARELLQHLRDEGLTLVVATSAGAKDLEALLRQAGLESLMDDSTNSDEAEHSKPAPDIVEAALEKAGVSPEHAVMLGDTPYDIEAAARAGVACIAVTSGGWSEPELAAAVEVYAHPADLLERYGESRLAR